MPRTSNDPTRNFDFSTQLRQWYAGGIVGLALFLVALSLMRPQTVSVQYECEILAPSVRDPARTQVVANQPTVEEMRHWLVNESADESAPKKVRVEWSCTNANGLLIRVAGDQIARTRADATRYATTLAKHLNTLEVNALNEHRQVLAERAQGIRQRVTAVENNLAVIVADFREAIAQSNSRLQRLEIPADPEPTLAPQPAGPAFNPPTPAFPTSVQPTPIANPEWTILQNDLQVATQQLQALSARFTPQHPLMQAAQSDVETLAARLQQTPQFFERESESPVEPQPQTQNPNQNQAYPINDDLPPIARGVIIRRTNWQMPVNTSLNLQPYLDDFQRQSRELEASRGDLVHAEEALRNFAAHQGLATSRPATVPHAPVLVSHRRQLPQDIVLWALVGSILAGCLFANYANHTPPMPLRSTEEVLSFVGMPVLSTVVGRRVSGDDGSPEETNHERTIVAVAELAVIVVVAAFLVSYACDPNFATVVAADPLVAISEIWRRN